jgi:putative CocE/NonD family hydrolase
MSVIIEKSVAVRMRDGIALATDVYRPDGGKHPALVMRLPYNKELPALTNFAFDVMRGVQAGYAVVVQDTRGRYASEGTFTPYFDEAADGADTIAWAAGQPWSSGNVGMVGGSYFGATQWRAATEAPPALRAIAPMFTGDQFYEHWAYQGGAFQLGFSLLWAMQSLAMGEVVRRIATGDSTRAEFAALVTGIDNAEDLYRRLPLLGVAELDGLAPYYSEWLRHPSYDEYWKATASREAQGSITVPALNIGGWYDLFLGGTIANYMGMRERGGSEEARSRQRLVLGPWSHGPRTGFFTERSFGLMSGTDANDLTGLQIRWFDWLLKGHDTAIEAEKPVKVFVMGSDVWRESDDWPLSDTSYENFFLRSGGLANTKAGDGVLSSDPPGDEPADVYLYDPRDPVPTVGGGSYLPGLLVGANAGPRDQAAVERRRDVLCYTTAPLAAPLEVVGPVKLVLYVSSSASDTDFTGKLVDVFPDGRAFNLTDGILRARYRDAVSEATLLQPGEVYELEIDLVATANLFRPGHRVRLEVSSSNFPRFDRNTNTGRTIATDGYGDLRQAVNRIHHRPSFPSRLVLPVIRAT